MEIQRTEREEKCQPSQNTVSSERKPKNETPVSENKLSKNVDGKNKVKSITNQLKNCTDNGKKNGTRKDSDMGLLSQISSPAGKSFLPKQKSTSNHQGRKAKGRRKVSDEKNKHRSKLSTKSQNSSLKESNISEEKRCKKDEKRKEKAADVEEDLESDGFEIPSMSFEEYLSYDLEEPKRKKRSCESKNPKRLKVDQKQDVKMHDCSTKSGKSITEVPTTVVNIQSNYL